MQSSKGQIKEASLDHVSQVCKVKREKTGASRSAQHYRETGSNFKKIFGFGFLVQYGTLNDLQSTVNNHNYLSL